MSNRCRRWLHISTAFATSAHEVSPEEPSEPLKPCSRIPHLRPLPPSFLLPCVSGAATSGYASCRLQPVHAWLAGRASGQVARVLSVLWRQPPDLA